MERIKVGQIETTGPSKIRFSQSVHIAPDGAIHLNYDVETPERVKEVDLLPATHGITIPHGAGAGNFKVSALTGKKRSRRRKQRSNAGIARNGRKRSKK